MNLLEKYKAMANTEEREKTQKRLIKGTTSNIRESPPVVEVSNGLAISPPEIVEPGAIVGAIWRNPYPQGTPAARAESLRVIEAARRGEP